MDDLLRNILSTTITTTSCLEACICNSTIEKSSFNQNPSYKCICRPNDNTIDNESGHWNNWWKTKKTRRSSTYSSSNDDFIQGRKVRKYKKSIIYRFINSLNQITHEIIFFFLNVCWQQKRRESMKFIYITNRKKRHWNW